MADAQAEKFYHGILSNDVEQRVVVLNGFELLSNCLKGDTRLARAHNTRPRGSDQPNKVSRSTPLWIARSHRRLEEGRMVSAR